MTERLLRTWFLPVSVLILALAALTVPLPLFLEGPGTGVELGEAVQVDSPEAEQLSGELFLLTVDVVPVTAVRLARPLFDETVNLVPARGLIPQGEERPEYFARQREVFRLSADLAAAVGLRAAGYDVDLDTMQGEGAAIVAVDPRSAAAEALAVGDVVVAVDGAPVRTDRDLRDAVQARGGEPVELTVRRGEEEHTTIVVPRALPEDPERPVLGVVITTFRPQVELPVPVEVEGGRIGGPSAGLMIALTVYDKLADVDLTRGRVVAGTGTIDQTGQVGPVGGVRQKVLAADRIEADVFLAPAVQAEEAQSAVPEGSSLEVLPVASLDEAIAALGGAAVTGR